MGGKRTILALLVCVLLLPAGQSSMAATNGGAEPVREGQSDVMAGVVVDYMGKLQFAVTDRDKGDPVQGASVEIYIPSLDRYVLFGITDEDGFLELDVAFGDQTEQFQTEGRAAFGGIILYLNDRDISYRIYKAGWLPYPFDGTVQLHTREVPQVEGVQLYQKKQNGGGGGNSGGGGGSKPDAGIGVQPGPGTTTNIDDNTFVNPLFPIWDGNIPGAGLNGAGGIPRTGVEGTMQYWIAALIFFLLTGGILIVIFKSEARTKGRAGEGEMHIQNMAESRNTQGGSEHGNTRRCDT